MAYPNGTSQRYSYDQLNRLTQLQTFDGTGALVEQYDYSLHPTGRRTHIDELDGRSTAYTYDELYRLSSESITDTEAGNYSASFSYDAVGNRLSQTINGETTNYTYDDNDRVESVGLNTYLYDDNGNTLTALLETGTVEYRYNSKNQLIEADSESGIIGYAYNVDGIRTEAGETRFVVDSNRAYAQVLVEDGPTVDTIYSYGDDLISQDRGGNTFYYHYDGLGSTRSLSDQSGTISDTYDYQAFGELLNQSGTTENRYLYTGEQFDEGLDQYYLRARYYDQGVGRFTQMDTWSGKFYQPVTLNKYLYAHADPANFVDPTGWYTAAFGRTVEDALHPYYEKDHPFDCVVYGKVATGSGSRACADERVLSLFQWPAAKPDILNHSIGKFNEIKPFSPSGISAGESQIIAYTAGLFPYTADSEWAPPVRLNVNGKELGIFNFRGVIFYSDNTEIAEQAAMAASFSALKSIQRNSNRISTISSDAVINTGIGVALAASAAYAVSQSQTLVNMVGMRSGLGFVF